MPEILYRKWRPLTFAELAGQEHVATTLLNALETGRVAHAYLFAGPRGTGKTTSGRLIAKALNCTDRRAGEPCNRCESCQSYLSGRALDLIELDAASNRGIDEIRSLRDKVAFASAGAFKVYLIDEVHMLTEAAFNALLKTLEEPPPHVVFVLATTESHKVPATIVSRCQRFDFRRISTAAAEKRLQVICEGEGFSVEPGALDLVVRSSTGSLRDAINLLDQLVTSYGPELSLEHVRSGLGLIDDPRAGELARVALAGDLGRGLELIASVRDDGLDLRQFQREMVRELRALLLVKSGLEPKDGLSDAERRELAAFVADVPVARVLGALKAFGEADLKQDPNSTLPLDLALADCILSPSSIPVPASAGLATETPRTIRPRVEAAAPSSSASGPASRGGTPPARQGAQGGPAADGAARPDDAGRRDASLAADVAAARANMDLIYDGLKARGGQPLAALVNGTGNITRFSESEVTFGFAHESILQRALRPDNLKAMKDVMSETFGRNVDLRLTHDPAVELWRRGAPSRSPLVQAAQEMGARILTTDEE